MDKPTRSLNVLVSEQDLVLFFEQVIRDILPPNYPLRIFVTTYAEEVLRQAGDHEFDLFVLLLNNIIFKQDKDLSEPARYLKVLRLVLALKKKKQIPIIGLYTWPNNGAYSKQAHLAGVDHVFKIPCTAESLKEAVRRSLGNVIAQANASQ